ncbi:MAG: hypothetical protein ACTSWN_02550 [Promethearchaeota archaeon]
MTGNDSDVVKESINVADDESRRHERKGLYQAYIGLAIIYVAMGMFMILTANILSTLPVNTPGVYDSIGRMQHVYGIRYGASSGLFGLAAATFFVGHVYAGPRIKRGNNRFSKIIKKMQENDKVRKWMARIMALIHLPILGLVFLVVGALIIVMASDPTGDLSQTMASTFYNLDVAGSDVDRLHFQYIMGTMPNFELALFGMGLLIASLFSTPVATLILQDTGARILHPNKVNYSKKARMYACKNLLFCGILFLIGGAITYGIGYVLGIGLDITWPLFKLANYKMFMDVYLWIPISIGLYEVIISIVYYFAPNVQIFRIFAWAAAIIAFLMPFYGFFTGVLAVRVLKGKNKRGSM